ncbi:hypothetical protein FIBSPDRAFT_873354 [Athelia psychrophila]|uniref:Uncharacterized protein n=1 Tax=Athelia psychrophila TaxID=1759441 RepID=A0A165YLT5_9AGAM|nr:hypothetical protein FIBSPDRAFT_873354 [Fibularhizoctonia sp. CBS 109695]
MTTRGLPAKLTTTNRCTSRPSAARFSSRGPSNGTEGPNVAEVASRVLMRHPSAMHKCFSGKIATPRILWNHNRPGDPR